MRGGFLTNDTSTVHQVCVTLVSSFSDTFTLDHLVVVLALFFQSGR
jgi:hypothetical protein